MKQKQYNSAYLELANRSFFTLLAIAIIRLGSYIPIPFINTSLLDELTGQAFFLKNDWSFTTQEEAFQAVGTFSGGALKNMSLFMVGISPFIISSILCRLLFEYVPVLYEMKKEDLNAVNMYTRYGTLLLATFQGIGYGNLIFNDYGNILTTDNQWLFIFTTTVSLVAGSMFLMWLADMISHNGLGSGSSLIIITNILSKLPDDIAEFFLKLNRAEFGFEFGVKSIFFLVLMTAFIVYVETSVRKIPIEYPPRQKGRMTFKSQKTYLPLKINLSGVIPAIGALNILGTLKSQLINISAKTDSNFVPKFISLLEDQNPLYLFLLGSMTLWLSIFWGRKDFNPKKISEDLQKDSAFIPFIRPGYNTAGYLKYIIDHMVIISALYLTFICISPSLISILIGEEIQISSYGLSILIVVSFLQEVLMKIDMLLKTAEYPSLMRNIT